LSLLSLRRLAAVGGSALSAGDGRLPGVLAPARNPRFWRYLCFSVSARAVLGALSPFLTLFLCHWLQLPAATALATRSAANLGAVTTAAAWGEWNQRLGAAPTGALSVAGLATTLLLWAGVTLQPGRLWIEAPALVFLIGVFQSGLTVCLAWLELKVFPTEGRARYAMMDQTAGSLVTGAAALGAGSLLQLGAGPGALEARGSEVSAPFLWIAALLLLVPFLLCRPLLQEHGRRLRATLRRGLGGQRDYWAEAGFALDVTVIRPRRAEQRREGTPPGRSCQAAFL
jgi:hypothetical protein